MPLTEEEKRELDRLRSIKKKTTYEKKELHRLRNIAYRHNNKEKVTESSRNYYNKNRDDSDFKLKNCIKSKKYARKNAVKVAAKQRESYKKNIVRDKARSKKWQEQNPERCRVNRNRWQSKNKKRFRASQKKCHHKSIANLSDAYVRDLLTGHGSNLKFSDIPQSLIEAKRVEIQMKRYFKEQQNG